MLEKCFFTERFTPELVNLLNDCGIKLGVNHATLKLFGRIFIYRLQGYISTLECSKT